MGEARSITPLAKNQQSPGIVATNKATVHAADRQATAAETAIAAAATEIVPELRYWRRQSGKLNAGAAWEMLTQLVVRQLAGLLS